MALIPVLMASIFIETAGLVIGTILVAVTVASESHHMILILSSVFQVIACFWLILEIKSDKRTEVHEKIVGWLSIVSAVLIGFVCPFIMKDSVNDDGEVNIGAQLALGVYLITLALARGMSGVVLLKLKYIGPRAMIREENSSPRFTRVRSIRSSRVEGEQ